MHKLPYLTAYPDALRAQVGQLIDAGRLGELLLQRYPEAHGIRTDKALYAYVQALKDDYLRQAEPVVKVAFDSKIHVVQHALGLHTTISRVQGSRLKAKREIRIASVFRDTPLPFLRMIAVHELAHLKEKEHDKAFYKLCCWMEPGYHQLEFRPAALPDLARPGGPTALARHGRLRCQRTTNIVILTSCSL